MMKKIFLIFAVLALVVSGLSNCSPSRKSGCPMTEKIIH
jgi:hypothetical protein